MNRRFGASHRHNASVPCQPREAKAYAQPMPLSPISDAVIDGLVTEAKVVPSGLRGPFKPTERNGHWVKGYEFESASGNRFVIKLRQACANPMNFSVILGYVIPGTYTVFRLRRYNGKSHFHSNTLERTPKFYDYHIHLATERYQAIGFDEDHFAEITIRFWDMKSAIDCLVGDCGFQISLEPLFGGVDTE